jgi:hypothetical protein
MAMGNQFEDRFDSLLAAYKQSFGEPEVPANFSPMLWQKIEARKAMTFGFERLAQRFVTAAMALCLLMGLFLITPFPQSSSLATYVEVLADEHEIMAYSDVTPPDGMSQQ